MERIVPAPDPRAGAAPSICFVSLGSYALLGGDSYVRYVGGAQTQQVILARELARRGYAVSFVVYDHGQPDGLDHEGLRVYKCYRRDAGLRGLRFLHPRLTGLWSALARADAQFYYQRGAGSETGLVGSWCRWRGRRLLFALAANHDYDPRLPLLSGPFERALYRWGLRHADAIITQTEQQQGALLRALGLQSTIVRSCLDLDAKDETSVSEALFEQDVLWVGRFSREKRPEWVLELARQLPGLRFGVAGQSNVEAGSAHDLAAALGALPNVVFHGYVPHAAMPSLYRRSRVLLLTSEAEGFPSVFLEAWASGVPVLSTVDPDGIIERYGLGRVAPSREGLKEALTTLRNDPDAWRLRGARGRAYVAEHHAPGSSVSQLEAVITRLRQSDDPSGGKDRRD